MQRDRESELTRLYDRYKWSGAITWRRRRMTAPCCCWRNRPVVTGGSRTGAEPCSRVKEEQSRGADKKQQILETEQLLHWSSEPGKAADNWTRKWREVQLNFENNSLTKTRDSKYEAQPRALATRQSINQSINLSLRIYLENETETFKTKLSSLNTSVFLISECTKLSGRERRDVVVLLLQK